MDEVTVVAQAAPTGPESFRFDGEFRFTDDKHVDWAIAWEVRDDYGALVHREARWSSPAGIQDWTEQVLPATDLPTALQEKILAARSAHRSKVTAEMRAVVPVGNPQVDAGGEGEGESGGFIEAPGEVIEHWSKLDLLLNEKGSPVLNADNALRVIEKTPAFDGRLWFDEFSNSIMTSFGCRDGEEREWTDHDTRALWFEYQRRLWLARIGKESVFEGICQYAFANKRHPVKEWLAGCEWDGQPRIGTFFRDYMGAEDNVYTRKVAENFFLSMLARIYAPGCKVDNMVVLEGHQGVKKSSALKALCGKWFTECNEPISNGNNKDFYAVLQGKMLVEIAELDSFSRADIRRIKAIITTATDRYRPAYGRIAQNFPRTSVFVGTTNEDEYLEDATGGRRFWPVKTGLVRLAEIERDRNQLFAEALQLYRLRPTWWEVPQEAALEQDARRKRDAWEEPIGEWCAGNLFDLTSRKIAKEALGFADHQLNFGILLRVAYCMKALGYKVMQKKLEGRNEKIWIKR